MKTLLALLFTLGLSTSAFSGNEGPQAMPSNPTPVVAEYAIYMGFAPSHMPAYYQYQILENGRTLLITHERNGDVVTKELKAYSTEEMQEILSMIAAIVPGELYDPNPRRPGCFDAPTSRIKVYSDEGEIVISEKTACKVKTRYVATKADANLIQILRELADSTGSSY